jgi:hypothetical protein
MIDVAQFTQQGPKLVGPPVSIPSEGTSVAVSGDGNTAIVGGPGENGNAGAAWVFFRDSGTWRPELTPKLAGTGVVGEALQGSSLALSATGYTAIVGGGGDNNGVGATWVFTRSSTGQVWAQHGPKLVANDFVGASRQGSSVALSADGNTAIVGGGGDNNGVGAAWVFIRSGDVWTQHGPKLVGTGAVRSSKQSQVALSADGNTAIVGGPGDNGNAGAAWVFVRNSLTGVWGQQGPKLVGTGAVGEALQGWSVAVSGDGNTAIVGGLDDYYGAVGAAWVFTRSGGAWTQQGKLVGEGALGARQGSSVALSADGNTAIVGGLADNGGAGAAWVFTRSGNTWTQLGRKLVGSGAVGGARQGSSAALSIDGNTAIVGGPTDGSAGAAWVYVRQ